MSNSLADTEVILINRLMTNIPAGFVAARVKIPNGSFTTPTAQPWLRLTVNATGISELDAQGAFELNSGILTVDIFYPIGTGSKAALNTANLIKILYNGFKQDDVVVYPVEVIPRGEDENFWHVQVDANFQFQILNTNLS
jgi:hypothetical protein